MPSLFLLPLLAGVATLPANPDFAVGPDTLLLRHPTVNRTSIVFRFADSLWEAPRAGGSALRLTTNPGIAGDPFFSPDGKMIAFSADYDGHNNTYVIPDGGGTPVRLTAHPAPETVVGWSPDSKNVIFSSMMLSNTDLPRLFKVPVHGGFPTPLPLPGGTEASYSPDGTHLAYVPIFRWETAWKRYRGGQAYKIWIADMADSRVKEIPRKNWNDDQPAWFGNKVYYLSDQTGPIGLYSYDVGSGSENVEIPGKGFDLKSLTVGPDVLAYEKLGSIHLYNPRTKVDTNVHITVQGDILGVRPTFKDLRPYVDSIAISPSGNRVAVAARGFVMTVPAKKGDVHATDDMQGVHRRGVAWSPDGKTVAYITDEGGYRQLALWDLATQTKRLLNIGDGPSLYTNPTWSPDSSKVVCSDYRQMAWIVDVKSGNHTKAISWATTGGPNPPVWSPDSKWLSYSDMLPSHFRVIKLYSLESGKSTQITDGLADATSPVFDRGGKYLYFIATTRIGQAATLGDLSSLNSPNHPASLYAVLLKKGMPNPLQPESDEEGGNPDAPAKPAAAKPEAANAVDLDGIENRIIELPAPEALYTGLEPASPGSVYVTEANPITSPEAINPLLTAEKFDWTSRKLSPAFQAITSLECTPDGSKVLVGRLNQAYIVPTGAPVPLESGAVDMSGLAMKVDPRAEWEHMIHEMWREAPLQFWSPITNGIDPKQMENRYAAFVKNVASRDDLNHLIDDMMGEFCVGHMFTGGGDVPRGPAVSGGLLGADYEFANGHYRITRVFDGEHWNAGIYAPLNQPGVDAKAGEYVLAIDGQPLSTATDIYLSLENKAAKQVKVRLGPNPDGSGSREVTVVPVANEIELRSRAWEEDNRRLVAKETNGRAGYVHVPDTEQGGFLAFNRYYYAQTDRDGIVVDERFNHGGFFNDYMIHEMQKTLMAYFAPRYGADEPTPATGIYGPKVLMINQFAGSGGDMFPWLFRQAKIGPLIGKRTWGGLIAVNPVLLADNGHYTAQDFAFFDHRAGKWDVENWGVSPDIDVDLDPYEWRKGKDSQLERAIEEINKRLAGYKPADHKRPAYPDKTKLDIRP